MAAGTKEGSVPDLPKAGLSRHSLCVCRHLLTVQVCMISAGDDTMKQAFALIFSTLALAALPISASAEIFIKIEGIQGASVKKGYEGWVVAEAMTYTMVPMQTQNRVMPSRSADGYMKPPSQLTLSGFEISRAVDGDSYRLRNILARGGLMSNVEIVVFPENGQSEPVLEYTLPRVAIEGIDATYGPGGAMETLQLRAGTVDWPRGLEQMPSRLPVVTGQ